MYTYKPDKCIVPIKIWSEQGSIESEALEQIENAASLPFAFSHVALMPDGHTGYGAPIGGVLATKNVIVPNFVGLDIGCGMIALKTSLKSIITDDIKKIMGLIRDAVPVGFNHNKEAQDVKHMPQTIPDKSLIPIVYKEYDSAKRQIGTLGGGNHFLELQKGSDGYIWIMVHSGSRNLGKKVAEYYNSLAKDMNLIWHSSVPQEYDLAFLPISSDYGKQYFAEMRYCVEFARCNRELIIKRIIEAFKTVLPSTVFDTSINIAHNYAQLENHFGHNVVIHRKGAVHVREGTVGVIPGSQGSKSYIVKGFGNKDSFESCSHGAGRKMSRTKARKSLNLQEEIKKMDDMGIIHGIRHESDLDEAAGAYKDIDMVMKEQSDLVETLVELSPLAVIKG